MREACTAITRRLHALYSPILAEPLPRELKDLVDQLVALEIGKRGSTERSVEALQSAIAQPAPQSYQRMSSGRKTDQMG